MAAVEGAGEGEAIMVVQGDAAGEITVATGEVMRVEEVPEGEVD